MLFTARLLTAILLLARMSVVDPVYSLVK